MSSLLAVLILLNFSGGQVRYFPSILYGHILLGAGSSRYDTTFTLKAVKDGRASLALFADNGEPMKANFLDESGNVAGSGSTFELYLSANRPLTIRLALVSEDSREEVIVKTGWATFHSHEEFEASAEVRITTPDGKLITRHVLSSEKPPSGD